MGRVNEDQALAVLAFCKAAGVDPELITQWTWQQDEDGNVHMSVKLMVPLERITFTVTAEDLSA